jgi:hypothetical protein
LARLDQVGVNRYRITEKDVEKVEQNRIDEVRQILANLKGEISDET